MEVVKNKIFEDFFGDLAKFFPIVGGKKIFVYNTNEDEIDQIITKINASNMGKLINDLVMESIKTHMRFIVTEFWNHFENFSNNSFDHQIFPKAVTELHSAFLNYDLLINNLNKLNNNQVNVKIQLIQILKGLLFANLNININKVINCFYKESLNTYCSNAQINQTTDLNEFYLINRKLNDLDLLECLVLQEVNLIIHEKILNHVKEICHGVYDRSNLENLTSWLNNTIMKWFKTIFSRDLEETSTIIVCHQNKFLHYLKVCYLKTNIDQMFYIIIEYPDSKSIIDDIRICLQNITDLKPELIDKLQSCLENRLLHQGVSTPDILTAYIAAIRALRRLDPTGILLDTVTEPVRKYLRSRSDGVRCIVSSLTEEGTNELADELTKKEQLHVDDGSVSDDEDTNYWEDWTPDPVDADPSKISKCRRTSDVISLLVNVFGSKELFVNDYRILLADRLLAQTPNEPCDIDKEIRYLELLKIKFGDSQLQYCEVMLKDIQDSRRLNANLENELTKMNYPKKDQISFRGMALVLSAQFWPPFKEESLELVDEIKKQLTWYTIGFEALKGNRTLLWKTHLGSVELEIEFGNRKLNLNVSPLLATIIIHFQNQKSWDLNQLSEIMKVPVAILRKRITYWQNLNLIREIEENQYELAPENENINQIDEGTNMICEEDDEIESALESAQDQWENELQLFWTYIVGYLTNLDSMSLDRIHQVLGMFVSESSSSRECSITELKRFLDEKVRQHKLILSGGFYRLPKI